MCAAFEVVQALPAFRGLCILHLAVRHLLKISKSNLLFRNDFSVVLLSFVLLLTVLITRCFVTVL